MNKLVKFSLAAVAIATLAACSSGGGKGGDSNSSVASSKPKAPATKPANKPETKPTTPASNNATKTFGGVFYAGKPYQIIDVSQHPSVLVIAGLEFPIQQPGVRSPSFSKISSQNVIINGKPATGGVFSGYKFSSAFGYIDAAERSAVYYQGNNPTTELPKGKATYVGDSVYVNNGKAVTQTDTVKLAVDFDNKNLTGTLFAAKDGIAAVTVKDAKLTGNGFEGKAVQNGQEAN